MTPATLQFLRQMLGNAQLQVGAPDFAEVSQAAARALAELDQAITASEPKHAL